jgi:hypothetical protein
VLSDEALLRAEELADDIAKDCRKPITGAPGAEGRIFLVHGNDLHLRDQVSTVLRDLGVEPVILSRVGCRCANNRA